MLLKFVPDYEITPEVLVEVKWSEDYVWENKMKQYGFVLSHLSLKVN